MAGFVYNPLSGEWSLSEDTGVNYVAFGVKKSEKHHQQISQKQRL
jgi:polyprenyldihydroxybenzoate methyltransferase/3-demethylubiquinol 3-O-methyltransferase